MTLTKQPSTRMVVFENIVFKNDNGCDNDNSVTSVELPMGNQQKQRVQRPNVLVRFSKRISNLSKSPVPIENLPSVSSPDPSTVVSPASSSFERQNSSESDLSLSKLDITDDYYSTIERTNTFPKSANLKSTSSVPQSVSESFQNFYSRFSLKRSTARISSLSNTITEHASSSSTLDSNTRLTRQFSTSSRKSIFEHNLFSCCLRCFFYSK
ncbi:unnamed protein product [Rotaria magnacalcarata]|uniref:Uncharacterized protein n=1 Tax=Rotaria magnacalcarata TaxID=392030 RepID=A0A8S3J4T1_9BILA|nr:unnamed protein product [Rotaria magnacalcarata]CAF5211291.1 unnamed protein product [Rotaria magnacalcarata]CAF5211965.1 unnamed protein product [Rotaria magnacalcarata]